ncbi:hypothetical protein ACFL35_00895 [Candidatus Riflebacteria bacterium]
MLKIKNRLLIKSLNIFLILCLMLGSEGIFQAIMQPAHAGSFSDSLKKISAGAKKECESAAAQFKADLKKYEEKYVNPLQDASDALRMVKKDIKNKDYKEAVKKFKEMLDKLFSPDAKKMMEEIEAAKNNVDATNTASEAFSTPTGSNDAQAIMEIKNYNQSILDSLRGKIEKAAAAGRGRIAEVHFGGSLSAGGVQVEYGKGQRGHSGVKKDGTGAMDASSITTGIDTLFEPTTIQGDISKGQVKDAMNTCKDPLFKKFAQGSQMWDGLSDEDKKIGMDDKGWEKLVNFVLNWGPVIFAIVLSIVTLGAGAAVLLAVSIAGAVIAGLAQFYKSYVVEESSFQEAFIKGLLAGLMTFLLGKFAGKLMKGPLIGNITDKIVGKFPSILANSLGQAITNGMVTWFLMSSMVLGMSAVKGMISKIGVNQMITAREAENSYTAALDAFDRAGGMARIAEIAERLKNPNISGEEKAALQAEMTSLETMQKKWNEEKGKRDSNRRKFYVQYFKDDFAKDAKMAAICGSFSAVGGGAKTYFRNRANMASLDGAKMSKLNTNLKSQDALLKSFKANPKSPFYHAGGKTGNNMFKMKEGMTFKAPTGKVYQNSQIVRHIDVGKQARTNLLTNSKLADDYYKNMNIELGEKISKGSQVIQAVGKKTRKAYKANVKTEEEAAKGKSF